MKPKNDRTLIQDLGALPRAFWFLFVGSFINRFGNFVMPFLALYLTAQGYRYGFTGIVVSAYGVGGFLGAGFGGYLADRIGRRPTIVTSAFASAVFLMLLYAVKEIEGVLLFSALSGLAGGAYPPACNALIADVVPPPLHVRAYATLRLAVNAGWAVGTATAGFLASISYAFLFVGDAVTTAVFAVIAWTALPRGRAVAGGARLLAGLATVAADRRFLRLFVASLAGALVFSQCNTTFGLQVQKNGFTTGDYGLLLALNGLMVCFIELPMTSITLRLSPRPTMAVGYALLGLGFGLNAFSGSLWMMTLAIVILTFGEIISVPLTSAYVAALAPVDMRGRYMGGLSFAWTGSMVIGPLLGMHLYGVSPTAVWLGCGLLGVLGAAVLLAPEGRTRPRGR